MLSQTLHPIRGEHTYQAFRLRHVIDHTKHLSPPTSILSLEEVITKTQAFYIGASSSIQNCISYHDKGLRSINNLHVANGSICMHSFYPSLCSEKKAIKNSKLFLDNYMASN
jgi:hypothetical protein